MPTQTAKREGLASKLVQIDIENVEKRSSLASVGVSTLDPNLAGPKFGVSGLIKARQSRC